MSYKGTYSDIRIYYKDGKSIKVTHKEFVKIIEALMVYKQRITRSSSEYYIMYINTELDGTVPIGIINLNEIAYTVPENV